jgi:transposase
VLSPPPAVKPWSCAQPVAMRPGFDGLFPLVRSRLRADPLSGHLLIFRNRAADRLKVLYRGGHGLCLGRQRLEQGRYHFPEPPADAARLGLSAGPFRMLRDGIDLSRVRRSKRWTPPRALAAGRRPAYPNRHGRLAPCRGWPVARRRGGLAGPAAAGPGRVGTPARRERRAARQAGGGLAAPRRPAFGTPAAALGPGHGPAGPGQAARPGRLAGAPGAPRGRARPDRGGAALPLLRPAARLHRHADGRAAGPGAGPLLRGAYPQEDVRLPALRAGLGAGRATPAAGRAGGGGALGPGPVWPGAAGARQHRQVRRSPAAAPPGGPVAPPGRDRRVRRWATGWRRRRICWTRCASPCGSG